MTTNPSPDQAQHTAGVEPRGRTLRFAIGDSAWNATWDIAERRLTCPDCGGTGRLRVTFFDESQVSISCGNCSRGYDPPVGWVPMRERHAIAKLVKIVGFEVGADGVRWRTDQAYIVEDACLFNNEDDALQFAQERCAEINREDEDRILRKEKDTRTWAWNASYHRREIKRLEQSLTYHRAKLSVAALKAREQGADQ